MTTVNGLPAHVLLVHAVVVLIPLVSVLLLVQAFWPAARRRLSLLTGALAVIALITVPITTDAGEWLEHRIPRSPLVHAHTELGDYMLPWAIALAVVALAFAGRELWAARSTRGNTAVGTAVGARRSAGAAAPGGVALTAVLAVLAVVVAVGSVTVVYRIGDSGARAAWTGQFSPTPLPGQPHPPGD